tara:strand:+ start:306 stop:662 length:357 start_codon:yes stop_codon:yes gene_type:complete
MHGGPHATRAILQRVSHPLEVHQTILILVELLVVLGVRRQRRHGDVVGLARDVIVTTRTQAGLAATVTRVGDIVTRHLLVTGSLTGRSVRVRRAVHWRLAGDLWLLAVVGRHRFVCQG